MKAALAFAALLAAFVAVTAFPRASQFRSSLDVVQVYATVRTSDGVFARDLKREDFEILDNGQRREISVFSSEIQPTTIAMVLDRSGSVASRTVQISNAAEVFVRKLMPDDRAEHYFSFIFQAAPKLSDIRYRRSELPGTRMSQPCPPAASPPVLGVLCVPCARSFPQGLRFDLH